MALVTDLRCGQQYEQDDDDDYCPFCNQAPLLTPLTSNTPPVAGVPSEGPPTMNAVPAEVCIICGQVPVDRPAAVCAICADEQTVPSALLDGVRTAIIDELSVGRDPQFSPLATTLARFDDVGRTHGRFQRLGPAVAFEDLYSRNGTFVNDVRISPGRPTVLATGDRVRLGEDCVFTMEGLG